MEAFLFNASIYLIAAVVAVPFAARLGLGSVLGYLLAGLVVGPILGLVGDTTSLQHVAEFGVVMMLFLIGLELQPRTLWDMRHRLLGLGTLQVLGSVVLLAGGAWAIGLQPRQSVAVGLILALSSTAIVLQTLTEKGLAQTQGGRSAFSVLLTQDIAVIPFLILLPLLAMSGHEASANGHDSISLVSSLPGWGAALATLGTIAGLVLAGLYLVRPVFRFVHAAHLPEMYTALALLIVVGIASAMLLVGLSPALGAFLGGVVLANSEFRHEIESDIKPFKGLLLGLFFITVGAGIDLAAVWANPVHLLALTVSVMILKGAILFGLGRLFGLRRRALWLFTLGLAQAGEFGFVLIAFSGQAAVLPAALTDQLLLIVALSMLLTPLSFMMYAAIAARLVKSNANAMDEDEIDIKGPVIIAGLGRFGQTVTQLVRSTGHTCVVLDHDMVTIELMRRFGYKGFLGDPTRPEVLHAAGLAHAQVLVVALDDQDAATRLTTYARRERPDLHIIARARSRYHVFGLYRAGANDIVRELFDSSLRAGRYVLENIGLNESEAAAAERAYYKHDRYALRELAKVWTPDKPTASDPAYIQRAKELEAELETVLAAALEDANASASSNQSA